MNVVWTYLWLQVENRRWKKWRPVTPAQERLEWLGRRWLRSDVRATITLRKTGRRIQNVFSEYTILVFSFPILTPIPWYSRRHHGQSQGNSLQTGFKAFSCRKAAFSKTFWRKVKKNVGWSFSQVFRRQQSFMNSNETSGYQTVMSPPGLQTFIRCPNNHKVFIQSSRLQIIIRAPNIR